MVPLAVQILVTLASVFSVGKAQIAHRCNPIFQKKIEYILWSQYGRPEYVLSKGAGAGREFVIWTTEHYYDPDVTCVYSESGPEGKTVKITTNSGTITSVPEDDPQAEHGGMIGEFGTKIKRMYVFTKNDIVVWYKCNELGPDGPPQLAMKVKQGSYNTRNVNYVKMLIRATLGIEFTKSYPHRCYIQALVIDSEEEPKEYEDINEDKVKNYYKYKKEDNYKREGGDNRIDGNKPVYYNNQEDDNRQDDVNKQEDVIEVVDVNKEEYVNKEENNNNQEIDHKEEGVDENKAGDKEEDVDRKQNVFKVEDRDEKDHGNKQEDGEIQDVSTKQDEGDKKEDDL